MPSTHSILVPSISTASFFYDGLRAASLGSDASVRIWDVTLGSPLGRYAVCNGSEVARGMVTGRVDNNLLCFGDLNGNVAIYDVREDSKLGLASWKLVCSLPQKAIADGIRPMDVEYLE
ncbi:unnamed protein product [Schistosoma curassoni]|uniref:WD_REPEATS_REGION domain-containing protein n=1 Tax=Schistosoma curassoni TaxID=6186 RepID=A0A183L4H1_9TREM|nr:unnamed protein product [Schistosoma curassoni]